MMHWIKTGWQLTAGLRRYLLLLYMMNLLVGIALAWVVGSAIAQSIGQSTVAYQMVDSFAPLWYQEFSQQATGLLKTFQPSISGMGAILDGLEALVTGQPFRAFPGLLALGIAYILLWVLFAAGAVGRMASGGERSFWNGMSTFAGRFILLTGLTAIGYYLVFGQLLPLLTGTIKQLTRDVSDARIVFYWTVGKYLLVWLLAGWLFFGLDVARIITVSQNRRVVPLAWVQGLFWVARHPLKVAALALLWVVLGGVGMVAYALLAPGAEGGSLGVVLMTFLVGQLYLGYRMVLRLWLWGSEVAMWQAVNAASGV